jgi:hypothetical protein
LIEEHAGSTLLRLGYPLWSQLCEEETPGSQTIKRVGQTSSCQV